MSNLISKTYKPEDVVRALEDIYSPVYDKVFKKGHEFVVISVLPLGLTIEDEDGFRLTSMGFMRFEVDETRGNYRDNHSSGWFSYR